MSNNVLGLTKVKLKANILTLFQVESEATPLKYTVVEKRLTWSEAQAYCGATGGRLAQPDSQEEHDRIKAKLQNIQGFRQFWFGLRKEANNQWQYTDGSTTAVTAWGEGRNNRFT